MVKPRKYGEFVGFTEEEVGLFCKEKGIYFDTMKLWYDGYTFKDVRAVYNPNSVMQAIENDDFDSYWTETSAAEGLLGCLAYDSAKKTVRIPNEEVKQEFQRSMFILHTFFLSPERQSPDYNFFISDRNFPYLLSSALCVCDICCNNL